MWRQYRPHRIQHRGWRERQRVRRRLLPGRGGRRARGCSPAGTTSALNIQDLADEAGITITLVSVTDVNEAISEFIAGECDLVTTDGSALVALRFADEPSAQTWVIFPPAPVSKEPLGPAYREGDSQWGDIVSWTVFASIIAEEKGITSANIDSTMNDDLEATRLFAGGEGEFQTAMGLSADAFYQSVKAVGNYGEIYDRNLTPIGLTRAGSLNANFEDGGLIYAPPAR